MSNWEKSVNDAVDVMTKTALQLSNMAHILSYIMSNSKFIEELENMSVSLMMKAEVLRRTTDQKSLSDFKEAQERSGLLLKAACAGIFVAGNHSNNDTIALKKIVTSSEYDYPDDQTTKI